MKKFLRSYLEQYPPKLSPSGVFIVDPGIEISDQMVVLHKEQTSSFEYGEISFSQRTDLDIEANEKAISGAFGENDDAESTCRLVVNGLSDWHVADTPTIQLQIRKRKDPFAMKFPVPIVATGVKKQATVKARLANHRAIADLVVEFINTDTGESEIVSIAFDLDFSGGKDKLQYQTAEIDVPRNYVNLEVFFSISFKSDTKPTLEHCPYLFIWDVHLLEKDHDHYSDGVAFSESDISQRWLFSKTTSEIKGLDCLFLKFGDEIVEIKTEDLEKTRHYFDRDYYLESNKDCRFDNIDPFTHYLLTGWKEGRNPNPEFSVTEYLFRHPDVAAADIEPLVHYACVGREEKRSLGAIEEKIRELWESEGQEIPAVEPGVILRRAQDLMVPMEKVTSRKLAVFVVPEHNAMSGGIYSIFSIANVMRRMRRKHGLDVLVMTRPNPNNLTYIRNSSFANNETVLRFEQLRLFSNVSELHLHIPEYATVEFVRGLSQEMVQYLLARDHLHINILNQNIRLMPEAWKYQDLRRIATTIGQSISHHAFSSQEFADRYQLPSLLLPAYTDLAPFPSTCFEEKENLIIYSDDAAPYRKAVMDRLQEMGDYDLVKIKDMTFDKYMDLATRCKFSVSFGEGFDGYVAQPIYQGGIGMALYTDEFFPDEGYKEFENFFNSEKEMIDGIVPTIRRLENDKERFEALNAGLLAKWEELYSYEDYVARIEKLANKEYEIFPDAKSHT